jgi:DNA primase large subunit
LVSRKLHNYGIEIPSFPIAVMIIVALANPYLKKRYALAEAKGVYHQLEEEDREKIIEIAKIFDWNIKPVEDGGTNMEIYDFSLRFTNFLKNATVFRDEKWKLVNRVMLQGSVYLTKSEASRLLQEEVRRYIEGKLSVKVGSLPPNIMERVEQLKQLFIEKRGKIRSEEIPKTVVTAAFPPCIKELYDTIKSGHHLSHIGRFALTSFLINIGMTVENVVDLFRAFSDFDERMTRYQVEHIAGEKGGRTKYIPPRCDTLRTHGVCVGADDICRRIRHPLAYYRRKLRSVEKVVIEPQKG